METRKAGKDQREATSHAIYVCLSVCLCVYIYMCVCIYMYVFVCVRVLSLFLFDAFFPKVQRTKFFEIFSSLSHTKNVLLLLRRGIYICIYMCVLLQLHDRSDRREPFYLRLQLFVQLVVFFVFIFDHL